ncbi:cytochrome c oxidase assembly protein COX16 homolog, mitochondrial isoform 2-T4 [Clarias gariepinus]|uniref:cytochrome c oxidase assembly protein COX16 homolog, mitochondrial n=1 Tax=Clarias gariepinus TaxID=13013 RepID=UPI00234E0EDB|nr:cytochrome c oxidase assembly protein COX16 homolog, mitochondrial [Clarias gariepinus]XP_053357488.1 cytochrome c oxidase assembly protein COX16 homolog, mitochondrial [Clarias gariepinus]
MWRQVRNLRRSRTVRYGVPMLMLVVGGSFGLREFTQIRYDAQKIKRKMDPALEARVKSHPHTNILQEEYEKLQQVDLDNWMNIRGPRPWENSEQNQEEHRAQLTKAT